MNQSSSYRGNFLEILQLVANHDKVIEERLESGPRNATYTSAGIQNSILMSLVIQLETLCGSVKEAKMFTSLVDKTKDLSKQSY